MKEVIFTRSIAGINKDKSKYRYGKGLIKSCNPDEVKRFVGSVAMLFDDYVNGKKKEARSHSSITILVEFGKSKSMVARSQKGFDAITC